MAAKESVEFMRVRRRQNYARISTTEVCGREIALF